MYEIIENSALQERNSFGVEAYARRLATFENEDDLRALLRELPYNETYRVLGGGNNILFTTDYPGTLLHPICRDITPLSQDQERVLVRVDAGVEWDDFVAWAVERGYGGVENLSLIPGYVGAAPVQNIGAYGIEVKETIEQVTCLLLDTGERITLSREACGFGYRDSIFKRDLRNRAVILSVCFSLSRTPEFHVRYGEVSMRVEALGGVSLHNIRQAVIEIRRNKLPDPQKIGNAGSFFKNPVISRLQAEQLLSHHPDMPHYDAGSDQVKLAAGWLIDQCGWRGVRQGTVGVHDKQALVLVNHGGATGQDVLDLARTIQADVNARFGVTIDMEVNLL